MIDPESEEFDDDMYEPGSEPTESTEDDEDEYEQQIPSFAPDHSEPLADPAPVIKHTSAANSERTLLLVAIFILMFTSCTFGIWWAMRRKTRVQEASY